MNDKISTSTVNILNQKAPHKAQLFNSNAQKQGFMSNLLTKGNKKKKQIVDFKHMRVN